MKILYKKLINIILILLIGLSFILKIYQNKSRYLTNFNVQNFQRLYQTSQFAEKEENRLNIIEDEELYALSGYEYLTTGNLSDINIEHPPLGKYFIGLSILIFNNQNIGQIIWAVLFISLLYLLGAKALNSKTLGLITVLLFMQEKLYLEQLTLSLLDIIQGVFLLLFLYLTLNEKGNKKILKLQGLSLGTIASVKYPTIAMVAFLVWVLYKFSKKLDFDTVKKQSAYLLLVTTLVFLLSYLPFFIHHPNPINFVNLQEKALRIHLSHVPEYPKFQVFNVLLFNQWLSWWGNKTFIPTIEWNILWPILTIIFIFSLIKFKNNLLIKLWSFLYLLFLSSRLFFPRYLFLLLPFLYINLFYSFQSLYKYIKIKK